MLNEKKMSQWMTALRTYFWTTILGFDNIRITYSQGAMIINSINPFKCKFYVTETSLIYHQSWILLFFCFQYSS